MKHWVAIALIAGLVGAVWAVPVPARPAAPDLRKPVPVTPAKAWHRAQTMMGFLEAVAAMNAAIADDDWTAVQKAATTLGPKPGRTCPPAPEPPGLHATGRRFRCQSRAIGAAARAKDKPATLRAIATTLRTCNACHAQYKNAPLTP